MSKERIPSLNTKMGSVKNLISNFEHKETSEEDVKHVVIEGDSNGLLEIRHKAQEHSQALLKNDLYNPGKTGDDAKHSPETVLDTEINSIIDEYQHSSHNSLDESSLKSGNSLKIIDFSAHGRATQHIGPVVNSVQVTKDPLAGDVSVSSSVYSSSQVSTHSNPQEEHTADFPTCKPSSTWEDGDILIQTFGYQSNSNDQERTDKQHGENLEPSNGDGETLKEKSAVVDSFSSQVTIDSQEESSKYADEWKLGDIDGLDKVVSKTRRSSMAEEVGLKKDQNPSENTTDNESNTVNFGYPMRSRSVSFKENPQTIYYDNKELIPKKANLNPWKYVCYGLVAATFFIYVITLTFNEFFTNKNKIILLAENDVLEYFDKSTNQTRLYLIKNIATKYNITFNDTRDENTKKGPEKGKLTYSPRENDSDIISISNTFNNINEKYISDKEIKHMMTENDLLFMFSGLSYAPEHVVEPQCGATLRNVMLDIARISKVTGRVRTYGTQCKQADLILQSIDELKVNMTLALGVWIGANEDANRAQLQEMKDMVKKYPRSYFHSIFIGNEVIYRNDRTLPELMKYIKDTKLYLKSLGMSDLPVGTSEIGSLITPGMFEICDFVGANIHPFFGGVDAQFGTRWALDYYHNQLLPIQAEAKKSSKLIISEIGWPYNGGEFINAVAGSWEYQQFLNDWLCTTPAYILNHAFFFEAFDEPWKKIWWDTNRTWETEWGFFDSDRKMKKHIYMPDCSKYGNPSAVDFGYIEEVDDIYENAD
jgi:exo-beta-1,3-glucanase (GH17 family)